MTTAEMLSTENAIWDRAPRTFLVVLALAWKLLLLSASLLNPGPGYDTSTQLLFKGYGTRGVEVTSVSSPSPGWMWTASARRIVECLTRWDAIYFASVAERGYILEQEWAFGWGFTRLLSFLDTSMSTFLSQDSSRDIILAMHVDATCSMSFPSARH